MKTLNLLRSTFLRASHPTFRTTIPSLSSQSSSPLLIARPSRLLSTSLPLSYPPAGSGKGGKAEKDAQKEAKEAAKAKKMEKAARDKVKAKEAKLKKVEKAKAVKTKAAKVKAKQAKDKAKIKAAKEKEKEKDRKLKAKAKEATAKPQRAPTSNLRPPKGPQSAWMIYLAEYIAEQKGKLAPGEKLPGAPALASLAAPLYRDLGHSERSEYLAKAQESAEAYPAKLEAWKATLTPADIKEENSIRAKRRKLGVGHKRPLKLDGEPKKPLNGYARFSMEAIKDPDQRILGGMHSMIESSKIIAKAWRELSEDDKKVYNDAATQAREAYKVEKADFDAEQERKATQATSV